jgi:hypothetical protein
MTIVRRFVDTPAGLTTKLTTTGYCGGSPENGAFAQLTLESDGFCMGVQSAPTPENLPSEIPVEPAPFDSITKASVINLVVYGDHEIETLIQALDAAAHDLRAFRDGRFYPPDRTLDARGNSCKTR